MTAPAGALTNAPTAPRAGASRVPGGQLGKDQFLKLLVAQMKNQDPLNPMEGQELATQLAQFSSVEQLIEMNRKLEAQAQGNASLLASLNNATAMNAIGRDVMAIGDVLELTGEVNPRVRAVVGAEGRARLTLLNEFGVVVGRRDLGVLAQGEQDIALAGLELGLPNGVYQWRLDVTNAEGQPVEVQQFVRGRVDGLEYAADGARLVAGRLRIPIGSVVSIRTP